MDISIYFFKSFFVVLFFVILGVSIIGPLSKLPNFLANTWRLKSSNQMVLCIFYVVTYMRHISNLELAIDISTIPSGTYILTLSNGRDLNNSRMLIISH